MNYYALFEKDYHPEYGDQVIFVDDMQRLNAGVVVEDKKEGWAVMLPNGKKKYPFASDTMRAGSAIKKAVAVLRATRHT